MWFCIVHNNHKNVCAVVRRFSFINKNTLYVVYLSLSKRRGEEKGEEKNRIRKNERCRQGFTPREKVGMIG